MDAEPGPIRRTARSLRSSVGRRLPEDVGYTLWQRAVPRLGLGRLLGHRVPAMIDVSRIGELERWPADVLSNPAELERLLPSLGINSEFAPVLPGSLRDHAGDGVQSSQYPNQFAPYLAFVGGLGISSYVEIGVDHGGTFLITTAYLNRRRPLERAVAVDRFDVPALRGYRGAARTTEVLKADSASKRFARYLAEAGPFDLALIDGDHTERQCRADFELLSRHARAIALHYIVGANTPGVRAVWNWIRTARASEYDIHEFTAQYPEIERVTGERYMGLGVAVRR
jgi:hypothetical protein